MKIQGSVEMRFDAAKDLSGTGFEEVKRDSIDLG